METKPVIELLDEIKARIKELLLKGDFTVSGVFFSHAGYMYDLNIDGIYISIDMDFEISSFRGSAGSCLMPNLSLDERKILIDFVMKGGIKQAIENCKQEIIKSSNHLKSLEDLYTNRQNEYSTTKPN